MRVKKGEGNDSNREHGERSSDTGCERAAECCYFTGASQYPGGTDAGGGKAYI